MAFLVSKGLTIATTYRDVHHKQIYVCMLQAMNLPIILFTTAPLMYYVACILQMHVHTITNFKILHFKSNSHFAIAVLTVGHRTISEHISRID